MYCVENELGHKEYVTSSRLAHELASLRSKEVNTVTFKASNVETGEFKFYRNGALQKPEL